MQGENAGGKQAPAESGMNRVDNRNTAMDKIVRKSAWTLFVTAFLFAALLILSADLISMGGKVETSRITDDDITVRIRRRDGALETYQGHNYPGLKYGDEVVLSIAPIGQERAIEHGTLIFSMYHCRKKDLRTGQKSRSRIPRDRRKNG